MAQKFFDKDTNPGSLNSFGPTMDNHCEVIIGIAALIIDASVEGGNETVRWADKNFHKLNFSNQY